MFKIIYYNWLVKLKESVVLHLIQVGKHLINHYEDNNNIIGNFPNGKLKMFAYFHLIDSFKKETQKNK